MKNGCDKNLHKCKEKDAVWRSGGEVGAGGCCQKSFSPKKKKRKKLFVGFYLAEKKKVEQSPTQKLFSVHNIRLSWTRICFMDALVALLFVCLLLFE